VVHIGAVIRNAVAFDFKNLAGERTTRPRRIVAEIRRRIERFGQIRGELQ
jgi:hypothetical protein